MGLILFEPVFRAFPAAQAVDLFGGSLGPDADPVVAVQTVIHINAVAVEMEVRDTGLAVRVERDDVLGVGKAAGRPVTLLLSGQPDPVESLDEIFGQLLPVFQGPAFGLLLGRGDFHPDHVVLQGTALKFFLPEFLVQLHIPIDGLWAGILREVVQFYYLCFSLTGNVSEGHPAV